MLTTSDYAILNLNLVSSNNKTCKKIIVRAIILVYRL